MLASDADRDAAAGLLSEAFAEGRLSAGGHGERVRAAYTARTRADLAGLTSDLSVPVDRAGGPGRRARWPGPVSAVRAPRVLPPGRDRLAGGRPAALASGPGPAARRRRRACRGSLRRRGRRGVSRSSRPGWPASPGPVTTPPRWPMSPRRPGVEGDPRTCTSIARKPCSWRCTSSGTAVPGSGWTRRSPRFRMVSGSRRGRPGRRRPGTDPALTARLFTAGLYGLMTQWHLAPGSFSWAAGPGPGRQGERAAPGRAGRLLGALPPEEHEPVIAAFRAFAAAAGELPQPGGRARLGGPVTRPHQAADQQRAAELRGICRLTRGGLGSGARNSSRRSADCRTSTVVVASSTARTRSCACCTNQQATCWP